MRLTLPRLLRHASAAMVLAGATFLAACSDPAAPGPLPHAADQLVTPSSAFDDFIAAQGAYCDDVILPCGAPPYDIGFIPCFGYPDPLAPCFAADFGGVNARYWERAGLQPAYPSFSTRGSVSETTMRDGRRRLKATVRSRNTFTALYAEAGVLAAPVLGADFFEYPFSGDPFDTTPDVPPLLSLVTADLDVILPLGFQGQPDMVAIWTGAIPAEVIQWRASVETSGELRSEYDGLAAGTSVRLTASYEWRGGVGQSARVRVVPTGASAASRRTAASRPVRSSVQARDGRRIVR